MNQQLLPKIDKLLNSEAIKKILETFRKDILQITINNFLDLCRNDKIDITSENKIDVFNEVTEKFIQFWNNVTGVKLTKVYNATGTILHTNLGRAPLPKIIYETIDNLLESYLNLEIDENSFKRTKRERFVLEKLMLITNVEHAVIVNNNAASLYLVLKSLSENKEVIVSRGELVEIGEGFRLPAIMNESGVKLIEVGTTNRTYISDYEKAINNQTALILKIHQSNFHQKGFTRDTSIKELSQLCHKHKIPLIYDLGSGLLYKFNSIEIKEPTVNESVKNGADVVLFSGDKLLCGPQAGIIIGKKKFLEKIRKHPLYRTYRLDKLSLLLLEKVLSLYFLKEENLVELLPHFRIISENNDMYTNILNPYVKNLPKTITAKFVNKSIKMGGGSAPNFRKKAIFLALHTTKNDTTKLITFVKNFKPKIIFKIKNGIIYFHLNYLNIEIIKKLLEDITLNY